MFVAVDVCGWLDVFVGRAVGVSSIVNKSINQHFHFVNYIKSNGWVSNRNNRYSEHQWMDVVSSI